MFVNEEFLGLNEEWQYCLYKRCSRSTKPIYILVDGLGQDTHLFFNYVFWAVH